MPKLKGFVLVYTLTIVSLIILLILAFLTIPYNSLASSVTMSNSIRAYYIAEAGIAKKFMDLRSGNTVSISEDFSLLSGNNGHYSVSVTNIASAPVTYRLNSVGTYKGVTRSISLTVKQISCARYGYFSNDEDQMFWWGERPIWFITGDTLRGPFHSNDQINIMGSPIFEGPVTSSSTSINYYNGGPPADNPDFRESLTLGAPVMQLPAMTAMIDGIRTASQQSDGIYLTGDTVITLVADGSMNVTNVAKHWVNKNMPMPANGALFVDNGYVDISGVLNGQLTLSTNRSIYVVGSLLYHDDPRVNPASADLMGLVAQNNVYIDSHAPYNVEVDGYIVALNTSFGVEDYDSALKGTLILYGGLTQYRRGPVGTFNSSTGQRVSGFSKDYYYDTRFQSASPLYFPPIIDQDGRIIYIKVNYAET